MAKPAVKALAPKQIGFLGFLSGISIKIVPGIIMGFMFHEHIERAIDYVLYHNVPVAQTSYQDPRGADTRIYTNENGERQLYVVTQGQNPQKVALDRDLLPLQSQLEEKLLQRYRNMNENQASDVLPFIESQKNIIYEKIKKK